MKKEGCGQIFRLNACEDRHKEGTKPLHDWCGDRLCPICWLAWATRAVSRGLERFRHLDEMNQTIRRPVQRNLSGQRVGDDPLHGFKDRGGFWHAVFSPPQDWALERLKTKGGIGQLKRELSKMLVLAGAHGGAKVPHPWRVLPRAKKEFKEARLRGEKYTKRLWHWLRKTHRINEENIYVSPHWHIYGCGWLMNSKEFNEKSAGRNRPGWIYKKIRDYKNFDELQGGLMYALSHAGIFGDPIVRNGRKRYPSHSLSYFGDLHKISHDEKPISKEEIPVVCPTCEATLKTHVGYSQEFTYDPDRDEERWVHEWNDPDSDHPPLCTGDPMIYFIEKWQYWHRDYPDFISIQERGRDPLEGKEKNPPDPGGPGIHAGHAFDHVSKRWYDENGEVSRGTL
ncbi:MAG: hypothetical protein KAR42_17335 [candidate division Zixibacteria bacterium]|nr:hypothetical protein [candidate division Zixibacteria bacterium]